MLFYTLQILLGLVGLYYGAEFLVQGSSRFASAMGVKPIIIGLTLVAFGTSAPEFFVSFLATLDGHNDISVGNVVGSNIANIGLILGLSALIMPVAVDRRVKKFDAPLVLVISIIFWLISLDGVIHRIDGIIFVAVLAAYVVHAFKSRSSSDLNPELLDPSVNKTKSLFAALFGLLILLVGARLLVGGAVNIARIFDVPELIIGLSIVALGTSLPELATAVYAGITEKDDISVGNIVGSNLFNILFVIGIVAIISPLPISSQTIRWDMPAMLILTAVMYVIMLVAPKISRLAGLFMLIFYSAYIVKLFFF